MDNELKEYVRSELDQILKRTFSLMGKDVKIYIDKILNEKDEDVILALTDFFIKFSKYSKTEIYGNERVNECKLVLNRALKLYLTNKERIRDNFFRAMDVAQEQGIDPIKIATLDNIRKLDAAIYLRVHKALTETEYLDPISGQKIRLYNDTEFKELIENCASKICEITEDRVGEVYSTLALFTYDKENNTYYISPTAAKDMIKRCGSLAAYPNDKLVSNIQFLKMHYIPPMSEMELVKRIDLSPSILMLDQNKVNSYEQAVFDNLVELRKENPALFPRGEEFIKFAKKYARDSIGIDKVTSISGLNKENLARFSKTKDVLVKWLGAKNAFETFTDFNILSMDPRVLDAILDKFTEYDKENGGFKMRTFFIKHPASALSCVTDGIVTKGPFPKDGKIKRNKPKTVDVTSIPENAKREAYLSTSEEKAVDKMFESAKTRVIARSKRRVGADGKIQLSEDELEEQEYWQEVFERIQEDLNATKFTSHFEELLSRTEAMIDAKMGKGYADKTFKTSEMKSLYATYLKNCEKAKPLVDPLFKILEGMSECEQKAKSLMDCSQEYYFHLLDTCVELGNKFFDIAYEPDQLYKSLLQDVLYKGESIVKSIGIEKDALPSFCFDRRANKDGFAKLVSLAVLFSEYSNFVLRKSDELFGFEFVSKTFDEAFYKFSYEKLASKELYYCFRIREDALQKIINITEPLTRPVDQLNLFTITRKDAPPPKLSMLAMHQTMLDALATTSQPTKAYSLQPDMVSLASKDRKLRNEICERYEKFRVMLKRGIGAFKIFPDSYEKLYTTKSGLVAYGVDENGESVVIFFREPNLDKARAKRVGVEPIPESLAKKVSIVVNNRRVPDHYSSKDRKALAPIVVKNDGRGEK